MKQKIVVYRHKTLKFYLSIIVLGIFLFGITFILKAFSTNFQNPEKLNNDLNVAINNNNTLTPIKTINLEPNNSSSLSILENIKSPFPSNLSSNNAVFLSKNADITNILSFDGISSQKIYSSDLKIHDILALNDSTISFIENDGRYEKLIVLENNQKYEVYSFELGELVSSLYFEPEQKLFYVILSNSNNRIFLYTISLNQKKNLVFQNGLLKTDSKIKYIDFSNNKLFIENPDECFSITFSSKEIKDENCEFIKNSNANMIPKILTDGIYLIDFSKKSKKKVVSKASNEVFDLAFLNQNSVYYIYSEPNSIQKQLKEFKLDSLQNNVVLSDLGIFDVSKLFRFKNFFYAIVSDELFRYENEEWVMISTDTLSNKSLELLSDVNF